MHRISLAKRLDNASIPSSLIERATGHQLGQPCPLQKALFSKQGTVPNLSLFFFVCLSLSLFLSVKVMFGLLIVYCSRESMPPPHPHPHTRVTTVSKRCLFLVIHLGAGDGVRGLTFSFCLLVCVGRVWGCSGEGSWEIWLLSRSSTSVFETIVI